jgi:predicted DNA-binding transcriptional regulator AlpA
MSVGARQLLTVPEFARHAGVSERTVYYDIKAGRLRSRSSSRPVRVPRSALAAYRGVPLTGRMLLTVRQVSYLMGMSTRTVRRRIREGEYVAVKVSARRLLIDAAPTRLFHGKQTIAQAAADLDWPQYDPHSEYPFENLRQRLLYDRVRFVVDGLQARDSLSFSQLVTVPLIARLSRKTPREVYHDISKGALTVHRKDFTPRRVWVRWIDAINYIDRARRDERDHCVGREQVLPWLRRGCAR